MSQAKKWKIVHSEKRDFIGEIIVIKYDQEALERRLLYDINQTKQRAAHFAKKRGN